MHSDAKSPWETPILLKISKDVTFIYREENASPHSVDLVVS
ncbi:hypothetical protein [Candidatus Nitrosocosmicus hydrocola]|nr:hypothetical protein [Candidatus Nitrosocosmicus hydrocola]